MPKKVFKISDFSKGLVGNASPRDIPDDGMSYGENVDSRVRGKIEGIPQNETVNASYNARVFTPLIGDEDYLIGQDSSKQFKKYDINTDTITNLGSATTNFANMVITNNKEAYASMTSSFRSGNVKPPKWVGEVGPRFGSGSTENVVEDMEIKSHADIQTFDSSSVSPFICLGNMPGASGEPVLFRDSGSVFDSEKTYYYAVSLIYDGYQESPLITGYNDGEDLWSATPDSSRTFADLCLRVGFNSSDLSRRVNGFNIYRAESPSGSGAPVSEYRLIKTIGSTSITRDIVYRDVNIVVTNNETSGSTVIEVNSTGGIDAAKQFLVSSLLAGDIQDNVRIDGQTYRVTSINESTNEITIDSGLSSAVNSGEPVYFAFDNWIKTDGTDGFPSSYSPSETYYMMIRDNGSQGATYEDNTGIPETLETTSVDYKIVTDYGGYLFVGGCAKDEIDDAAKYIFRSKPKTYSIIDWSRDFVILPEEPKALMGFAGRLYAFGSANMYRINPLTLSIEDTYAGVGALNENMVVATNYGMFHADDNNIYHNTGTVSQPIGDPILTLQESPGLGWQELTKTDASDEHWASMAFDPKNKRLLLFAESSGTTTVCWAYDVERKRWDLYTNFDIPQDTAIGPNGTVYATTGDSVAGFDFKSLFTSATRKNWKVKTRDFDLGSDSGDFWAYDLQGYGEGNFNIKYAKDGGSLTDNGTSTVEGLRKTTVASADKKMKSIAVQVESASGSDSLDNLTIQFRPQVIQE